MNKREKHLIDTILEYDEYTKKEGISASQLGSPALQIKLKKDNPNHKDDVDNFFKFASRLGTSWHTQCEKGLDKESDISLEEILTNEVDGQKIAGQYDFFDFKTNTMYDHKTMQHWKATILLNKDHKDNTKYFKEFIPQMSQLKYLWNKSCLEKHKCNEIKIIVWVVDYKKPYQKKDGTYSFSSPKYFVLTIPTMSDTEYESFLAEKVKEIALPYDEQKQCSDCKDNGWRYDYCSVKSICPIINEGF